MLMRFLMAAEWRAALAHGILPSPFGTLFARMALVLALCIVGVFGYNNRWFEVSAMLVFGVIGLLMERAGFPLGPFVIGVILAPSAQAKLRSGLMMTGGGYLSLLAGPPPLMPVSAGVLALPFLRRPRREARDAPNQPES